MKYSCRALLAGACLALTTPVFATNVSHLAHLIRINSLGDGRVVLQFDVDNSTCPDTNNPKGYYMAVGQNGVTTDGLKDMLSTAMLTYSLGKSVLIMFDNSTAYCYVNQLTLVD